MSFVYNIFHLDKDTDRDDNYSAVLSYMPDYAEKLDSPTVGFSSVKEVDEFCAANPDFVLDYEGYNPRDLTRNILLQSLPLLKGWKLGEIGIWASNFLSWKAFLETDADYLVLMEDDCLINQDFMPKLIEYMEELPEDWDIYHHFVHFQDAPWYSPKLDVGAEHVCRVYQEWSNLCYVINRRSAQKLLGLVKEGITLPLDWFWSKQLEKITTYTLKPKVYSGIELQCLKSTFQTTSRRLNFVEELAKYEDQ
jgi:GR25 family glycosyltransferase involved in LPS biosynthesis